MGRNTPEASIGAPFGHGPRIMLHALPELLEPMGFCLDRTLFPPRGIEGLAVAAVRRARDDR